MSGYNPIAWATFKDTLAAIESPDPTQPVGNCPACGVQLMTFRGGRSGQFFCEHPGSNRCGHSLDRIAVATELGQMREQARQWIYDNMPEGE